MKAETIQAKDGRTFQIDQPLMMAALDRADKYLEEAVRWSQERKAHVANATEARTATRRHDQFLQHHHIPEDVWFPSGHDFTETNRLNVMAALHYWAEGTMENFENDYAWLEEDLDLDPTYILFGIPITLVDVETQEQLRRIGAAFAARDSSKAGALDES